MSTVQHGTLVVTFFNTHYNPQSNTASYKFILFRECDPNTILQTFEGELAYGEKKTFTVSDLRPGNYLLVGLKLPDPKPGNPRMHRIMIYSGIETVYDICYMKSSKLTYE